MQQRVSDTMTIPGWIKINLVVSIALLGSVMSATAVATLGYQAIITRMDRFDTAIYGSPQDLSEPGLRADMRSVDRRINATVASIQATDARLNALKDRFEYSAYRGGGTPRR